MFVLWYTLVYLIEEHELAGRVGLVEEVEVVEHRRVGEHEVHDLVPQEAAQLSDDLEAKQYSFITHHKMF